MAKITKGIVGKIQLGLGIILFIAMIAVFIWSFEGVIMRSLSNDITGLADVWGKAGELVKNDTTISAADRSTFLATFVSFTTIDQTLIGTSGYHFLFEIMILAVLSINLILQGLANISKE